LDADSQSGTLNQDISVSKKAPAPTHDTLDGMGLGLLQTLQRLGTAIAAKEGIAVT
jgi:hypothetical protein